MSHFTTKGRVLGSTSPQPSVDKMDFDMIVNSDLRKKARTLSEVVPYIKDVMFLRDCIMACGSDKDNGVDNAANLIYGNPPHHIRTAISKLVRINTITERQASAYLIEAQGDYNKASILAKKYQESGKTAKYFLLINNLEALSTSPLTPDSDRLDLYLKSVGFTNNSSKFSQRTNSSSKAKASPSTPKSPSRQQPKLGTLLPVQDSIDLTDTDDDVKAESDTTDTDEVTKAPPFSISSHPPPLSTSTLKSEDCIPGSSRAGTLTNAERIFELLYGQCSLEDCHMALNLNGDDIQKAMDSLCDDPEFYGREKLKTAHRAASGGSPSSLIYAAHQEKRNTLTSGSDRNTFKRQRVAHENSEKLLDLKATYIDTPGPLLENAKDWLQKFYPDSRNAVLRIGQDKESRDTIPRKILYDNSTLIKAKYDAFDGSELNEEILLPEVVPTIFDLAIQALVCKNFTLEHDPNITKSDEIGIILEIIELSQYLGLPDPGAATIPHLTAILTNTRIALTTSHLRRAYTFLNEHPVQKLFTKAIIQQFMRRDVSLDVEGKDEEEDDCFPDDHLDYARVQGMFGIGMRFRYIRERRSIKQFKRDLADAMDEVTSAKEQRPVNFGKKRHEVLTWYKDPLTGEQWSP